MRIYACCGDWDAREERQDCNLCMCMQACCWVRNPNIQFVDVCRVLDLNTCTLLCRTVIALAGAVLAPNTKLHRYITAVPHSHCLAGAILAANTKPHHYINTLRDMQMQLNCCAIALARQ